MAVMHLAILLECSEGLPLHVFDHLLGRYPLIESFVYFLKPVIKEGPPAQEEETPHVVSEGDVTIGIDGSVHSRFIALTLCH
jgi:hypothetical protein